MNFRALTAEFVGTFVLSLAISLSVGLTLALSTPAVAGLTLGLFVYTVGGISGAHLNPAVTLGLLSIERIKLTDALLYMVAQFLGAGLAMVLFTYLQGSPLQVTPDETLQAGIGEAIGAFILVVGIVAVVAKSAPKDAAGLVIGGSLLLGVFVASAFGNGVVNPAVAWAVGSFTPMYILGPIVGSVAGAWVYRLLAE